MSWFGGEARSTRTSTGSAWACSGSGNEGRGEERRAQRCGSSVLPARVDQPRLVGEHHELSAVASPELDHGPSHMSNRTPRVFVPGSTARLFLGR
jgi:hypothetical protein